MAPVRGLEPLTHRLTADCATIAPHRNGLFLKRTKTLKFNRFVSICQEVLPPQRGANIQPLLPSGKQIVISA
jgi:hypothetical protein